MGQDEPDGVWFDQVLFVIRLLHETSARLLREILEKKYLTKSIESRLQLKRRFYRFQMKRGNSVDERVNSYTKLLTYIVNVDVKIDEEDKAVILLNSLLEEEYETFTLTLINVRQSLNYNEMFVALVNYEVRRQISHRWSVLMPILHRRVIGLRLIGILFLCYCSYCWLLR